MRQAHYTHAACGGTIYRETHTDTGYWACLRCGAYVWSLDDDGVETTADDVPDGCDMERNRQAWDAGEWRSPDAQPDDVPVGQVRCESGDWSGDGDHHTCAIGAAVRVWYVPEYRRDTARTLRSWDGLSLCIVVCPECAEHMAEHDPVWTSERYWGGR